VVADGSADAAERLDRVLTNDPGTGVARHADAGYERARDVAAQRGVRIPMATPASSVRHPPGRTTGQ
jgi:urocanate hydratase